jgi:hypothetical protein
MPINIQAAGLQANINAPAADAVIEEIKGQTNVKQ